MPSLGEQTWKYICPVTSWGEKQEITIECHKECNCEHCGALEPYDLIFSDDCTTWCEDCMNDGLPDDKMIKEAREHSRHLKILYFEQRIKDLEDL